MTISFHQPSRRSAFTMIEIALSLAIIGFALVAILGILPISMRTQKENREETIINQDASLFLDAIRSGARGYDDLTNYVMGITNVVSQLNQDGTVASQTRFEFRRNGSWQDGNAMTPPVLLTNGATIVGLLSKPKYIRNISNYTYAVVRSLSGPVSEKMPQNNPEVQQLALSYRLISEVTPYGTNQFDPVWTNWQNTLLTTNSPEFAFSRVASNLNVNLHDLRLTFRWPILPGGLGNGRQVFRTMVSGNLLATNNIDGWPLYFFESRDYVRAP